MGRISLAGNCPNAWQRWAAAERAFWAQRTRLAARWLAIEWHLPRCPKIGRTMTHELADYCQTHGVSFDWLLSGDLKDLQRMMEAAHGQGSGDAGEA
jgi:hypothetical protein